MANKVSQILESTSSTDWDFIDRLKNPADVCLRGVFRVNDLLKTDKHGQNWLS